MKISKAYILIIIGIIVSCDEKHLSDSTQNKPENYSKIYLKKDTIDLGNIKSGSKKVLSIYAYNISDIPLIIDTLRSSCFCTIGISPKKPILKNDSGLIIINFEPKLGVLGYFEKSIVLSANTRPSFSVITIKGYLVE